MKEELINYLESFILESRKQTLDKVLSCRTRYITFVLEDLFQPHNASAVLRSCDCFGIQDIHIIENKNKYAPNIEIAMGSEQWLTLKKYNKLEHNSKLALNELKNQGYRIIATSLKPKSIALNDFDLNKGKCAIVFGTELTGISDVVTEMADEFITIPMVGFTESLNISVAAALIAQNLTDRLRNSDLNWQIPNIEKLDIKLTWLRNSIKKVNLIERRFFEKMQ